MPILFYDGHCALCQRSVRILARIDTHRRLQFAPLGGSTASHHHITDPPSGNTAVYLDDLGHTHRYADAPLRAARDTRTLLGRLATLALILPRPLRTSIYNAIAKRRRNTPPTSCVIPTDPRFLN